MDAIDQPFLGEFLEGPGKRGLGRDFGAPFPSADASHGGVDREAFDERPRRGQPEDGLGDESASNGAPIFPRPPASAGLGAHVGFQPDRIEHGDQLLELGGERIDLFAQEGEQPGLDVAPARFHRSDRILLGHDTHSNRIQGNL
jgi:hypothetical protein